MKILRSFEEFIKIKDSIVCALGTFDGLHLGHKKVIETMMSCAKKENKKSMVITFDRHPLELLQSKKKILYLMDDKDRQAFLERWQVDYLFLMPLTESLLQLEPEDFIAQLCKVKIDHYFIGDNFTFGKNGRGTPRLLKELTKGTGSEVHDLSLLAIGLTKSEYIEDNIVSSTRIRHDIELGNMEIANRLLGHPFGFHGTVIYGDQRGRLLGFPTANFLLPNQLVCPPDGVYVNRVLLEGKWYNGIGNIGDNPTFENQFHRCEIHILDFDGDIYGKELYIQFLSFIRPEVKFNSLEELIQQMDDDKVKALNYLRMNDYL